MSSFIPFLFPLFVVLVFAQPFSYEFTHNYIFYTHSRTDFKHYIHTKLLSNCITVFITFVITIFTIFLISYYIEPVIGIITYQPEQLVGHTTQELLHYEQTMFTFSQLISISPLLMGILYSLWVGLNAILYSLMAVLALLLIENIFVALSVPFLFYHISSFIVAVLGFEKFLFDSTIFPFNIEQQSFLTLIPPFLVVVGINIFMYRLFIKRLKNR